MHVIESGSGTRVCSRAASRELADVIARDLIIKKNMASMFAEATKKAAAARFKQPATDAEGQEIEVFLPRSSTA